jgi:uncharacterized membrane protein
MAIEGTLYLLGLLALILVWGTLFLIALAVWPILWILQAYEQ